LTRLRLDGVGRTYAENPPIDALADVSLTIEQGEFVAVQGPSGSGKSSLLNVVGLIDRPTAGRYFIDDTDTATLSERGRAQVRSETFGFIFQSFHLIASRSACENVELGLVYQGVSRLERRERALNALGRVGMTHRAEQAASKLSGGERQRVAIARAIVGDASVVVADEPTGNLDSATSQDIVEQLEQLHRAGKTVLLVTHDPDVAAVADRQITVRDGRVAMDGLSESSRTDPVSMPIRPSDRQGSGPAATDLGREALRAIQGRPGRAAALVAAVAVAVALIVATIGLAQTASSQVSDRFDARRNKEVTVTAPALPVGTRSDRIAMSGASRVERLAGVDRAGSLGTYDQRATQSLSSSQAQPLPLMGISRGLLETVDARVEWAPRHRHDLGRRELLVGAVPSTQLELASLASDPTVLVDGVPFAVVGIIRNVRRAPELLASIVTGHDDASTFGEPTGMKVLIQTVPGAAPQVARQAPIALDPFAPERLDVRAPIDPSSLRDEIKSDLATTLLALTLVAALASIIGVANAMMMSVVERIGELGLRRAVGALPIHILGQTSIEALLLGLAGGVAGFITGTAGILAVTLTKQWQPVLDLRLVPLALAGGSLVGVIGGLAAAVRASRIQPIDALRR
jgi:macrolide transport system ATP-binding/permease protein